MYPDFFLRYILIPTQSRTQCDESDGTAGYTVGPNELTSYGVSWGAGISASGWIFAGFSVSKTETTGNIDLCTNKVDDEKKDVICIWKRVGHKSPQFLTRLQRKDCEVIFFEANTQSKTGSNIKWLALGTAQQIPTKCGPRTRTMLNTTNLAWYDECWIVGPEQDSWRPCPVSLT